MWPDVYGEFEGGLFDAVKRLDVLGQPRHILTALQVAADVGVALWVNLGRQIGA
ncbi:hypothetical protein D9M71_835710 [compost metagenome]